MLHLIDARTRRVLRTLVAFLVANFVLGGTAAVPVALAANEDVKWIWTPSQPVDKHVPAGVCYFRKSLPMGQPESGEVQITCDDAYELFVNGRKVGEGDNWRRLNSFDITKYLTPGRNTVAVKATNKEQGRQGWRRELSSKTSAARTSLIRPTKPGARACKNFRSGRNTISPIRSGCRHTSSAPWEPLRHGSMRCKLPVAHRPDGFKPIKNFASKPSFRRPTRVRCWR